MVADAPSTPGIRDVLTSVAGMVTAVAKERRRAPTPPRTVDDVPLSAEHLTDEWLTAVLCSGTPGARVVSHRLGEGSDGTSSRRAVTVTYDDAGRDAGLPVDLYTKATPKLRSRILIGITGAAAAENLFYMGIRPHLQLEAPRGYHGGFDARTGRSLLLTDDIAVQKGATFGNAAIEVDRADAESMVREMARYHGPLWGDPRLRGEWAARGLKDCHAWQAEFNVKTRFGEGAMVGVRFSGDLIPEPLRRRRKEIVPAAMRSLRINADGPQTLLHQDTHPANWFRLPDGSMHLYDWQGIARGGWALDYAYALSAALDVEDRRAWERELLALYLDELAAQGGDAPSFDDAWLQYRQQMLHGLIFWLYTLAAGRLGAVLQPMDHCRLIVGRIAQAMVDLETLDAVR